MAIFMEQNKPLHRQTNNWIDNNNNNNSYYNFKLFINSDYNYLCQSEMCFLIIFISFKKTIIYIIFLIFV